jgi:hypothetical protein
LQVEIDDTLYSTIAQVEDVEIKRRIVTAAMELIQFTGVLGRGDLQPAQPDKTQTWREDLRQGSRSELERARSNVGQGELRPGASSKEVEDRFLNLLSEIGPVGDLPETPNLASALKHRMTLKSPEPERPRTFVDDINVIVQRRVKLIPALQGRGLHLGSGPAGKVLFLFEGQSYEQLEDIPNLTAQDLVRDSIREWDETT